jgi:hypothetical protein
MCLLWHSTPPLAMASRPSVTFRPTAAQRAWLDRQRSQRGIPITTLLQLALERAMQEQQEAPADASR